MTCSEMPSDLHVGSGARVAPISDRRPLAMPMARSGIRVSTTAAMTDLSR